MVEGLRWLRLAVNFAFLVFMLFVALNHQTAIYLIYQAQGQLSILFRTSPIADFKKANALNRKQMNNILLAEEIKKYSVDSLGYEPTDNFTSIYDQKNTTLLWVITASEPYGFKLYTWSFPVVGEVTYKGFFKKELAMKEYNHLVSLGYDVDLRGVSAWSTLGWLSDPLLSNMLDRSKGSLCNLLFHELFHATYYAPGSVSFNENIASFVAHKATLRFLRSDTTALAAYIRNYNDNKLFNRYMLRQITYLKNYYKQIQDDPNRQILKLKAIFQVTDSVTRLALHDKKRYLSRTKDMLKFKNAYFVDFLQYDSMQDSLEEVFNKIYKGNIENLVRDLKRN